MPSTPYKNCPRRLQLPNARFKFARSSRGREIIYNPSSSQPCSTRRQYTSQSQFSADRPKLNVLRATPFSRPLCRKRPGENLHSSQTERSQKSTRVSLPFTCPLPPPPVPPHPASHHSPVVSRIIQSWHSFVRYLNTRGHNDSMYAARRGRILKKVPGGGPGERFRHPRRHSGFASGPVCKCKCCLTGANDADVER